MNWTTLTTLSLVAGLGGPVAPVRTEPPRIRLTTYLLFDGNCRAAMTFYQSVLGGTLTMTTVGESPMQGAFPPSMQGKIVSARLTGALVDLSASDWLRPTVQPISGNRVMLYLSGGTPAETRSLFQKLSEGADVTDPFSEQPFGWYGALNDRFGNRWMFHADAE